MRSREAGGVEQDTRGSLHSERSGCNAHALTACTPVLLERPLCFSARTGGEYRAAYDQSNFFVPSGDRHMWRPSWPHGRRHLCSSEPSSEASHRSSIISARSVVPPDDDRSTGRSPPMRTRCIGAIVVPAGAVCKRSRHSAAATRQGPRTADRPCDLRVVDTVAARFTVKPQAVRRHTALTPALVIQRPPGSAVQPDGHCKSRAHPGTRDGNSAGPASTPTYSWA